MSDMKSAVQVIWNSLQRQYANMIRT